MTGPGGDLAGFDDDPFDYAGIEHHVYRAGAGPAVIVMHELPGLDRSAVAVAKRIQSEGFTVVMPDLLPALFGIRNWILNIPRICRSSEFRALALGCERPVNRWLQELAVREHRLAGGPGVGIVGMCFSGGFALAAATKAPITVAVASQPSLPLRWRAGAPDDLGMPADAETVLATRSQAREVTVRAFRYDGDFISPPERLVRLGQLLGDKVIVHGIAGKDHPVLDRAVGMQRNGRLGTPDPNAVPALTESLRVLRVGLLGAPGP